MRVKNNMCFDCQQLEMQCRCAVDCVGHKLNGSVFDGLAGQAAGFQQTKLTFALLASCISTSPYGNWDREGFWNRRK